MTPVLNPNYEIKCFCGEDVHSTQEFQLHKNNFTLKISDARIIELR